MRIHGETEIILKTKHGRVDRYKSSNTFQADILGEGLRGLGYSNASIYSNLGAPDNQAPAFAEIVGGILLFKDSVPANSQFMNAGNEMVGNGAYGVTNASEPNELGSYNAAESIIAPSSITQVYDFTTAQANGTISSVCLTSRTGGLIGYGNANMKQVTSPWNLHKNAGMGNACPQAIFTNNNNIILDGVLYNFDFDTGANTVTVKKYKLPLKNASVFDGISETSAPIDVSGLNYSFFTSTFATSASNGKIYLSRGDGYGIITVGTYYIWVYDPSNDTITEKTFTSSANFETFAPRVAKDKLFMQKGGGGWAVFNLDGSLFDTIAAGTWTGGVFTDQWAGQAGDNILLWWLRDTGDNKTLFIYDDQNKTIKKTNGSYNINNFTQNLTQDDSSKALTFQRSTGGAGAFCNPLYLATINNLQTPVVKNNTMSMKIFYKLEEV